MQHLRIDLPADVDGDGTTEQSSQCFLYTSSVTTAHTFVKLQFQGRKAFCQVRQASHGTTVSTAVIKALKLDEIHAQYVDVELYVCEDEVSRGNISRQCCGCQCSQVAQVQVKFQTRQSLQAVVLAGLQQTATKMLRGVKVWEGRVIGVTWLNTPDVVTFENVVWSTTGDGCAAKLGEIGEYTSVVVGFTDIEKEPSRLQVREESVEMLVGRVARRMGGINLHATKLIRAAIARLDQHRRHHQQAATVNVGAIISGLPGAGKTCLAKNVADALGVAVVFLHAADIFQAFVGHSEAKLVQLLDEASQKAPSVLLIDDIESITTPRHLAADGQTSLEIGVLGTFLACLDKIKQQRQQVFVLGTTSRMDDVDVAVYSNGRLDLVVRLEPPSQEERLSILQAMTSSWEFGDEAHRSSTLKRVSEATGGYVGADLLSVCQKTLQQLVNSTNDSRRVEFRHFEEALATSYPSALQAHQVAQRGESSTPQATTSSFAAVYGMDRAIEMLRVSLLEPLENVARFLSFGTVPPRGILLTGPPGSGKSYFAQAVAEEVQRRGLASFVSVRCTDLITKVVGDTEKTLRELFETARNAAPCVLYFDQIECIAPVRGFDTSTEQTFDRLLSMLLVEMDGFSSGMRLTGSDSHAQQAFLQQHVVILASTGDKKQLDPAILRPGRFDVHIALDFPDETARAQIVRQVLTQVPLAYSSDAGTRNADEVATFVAARTIGYAASELTALFREAALAAMRDRLDVTAIPIHHVIALLST